MHSEVVVLMNMLMQALGGQVTMKVEFLWCVCMICVRQTSKSRIPWNWTANVVAEFI